VFRIDKICLFNGIFSAKEDNTQCIEVLVDFVEEFDVSEVLHMLPDDWSMAAISKALHRALRLKLHQVNVINRRIKCWD